MDPISSSNSNSNSGAVAVTTPQASGMSAPASERPAGGLPVAAAGSERYASATTAAGQAEIPEPPGGAPRGALGQEVLDRAFAEMSKLEAELKNIDPTSPEGAKRMAEVTRLLNRIDEMIHMINEMRKDRHDANMAAIANIAS